MGKKVVIIGGGIVGLCCAYYLQNEGHNVILVDKSSMNSGASYVNAGYLTPSHIVPLAAPGMISKGLKYMFNSASPFYMKPRLESDFLKWAWAFKKSSTPRKVKTAMPIIRDINLLSRDLYDDLKNNPDLGGFHYERKGLLMYFQTNKEGDHEIKTSQEAKKLGLESNILDKEGIKEVETGVSVNAIGAVHYHCDGHTTPVNFMEKMKSYLLANGVQILKDTEVVDFGIEAQKLKSIKTKTEEIDADHVVFAAGSWTKNLSRKLDLNLLLEAGKGYRIDVSESTGITMPAILLEAKMAVTPMQGFTRFAGTMEFSGVNHHIRKERVDAIASGAEEFYEGLKIATEFKQSAQCGLRPVSPDGLPYIGPVKNLKNLTIATGHAMMGWSLGPATGKLVAELVSEKKPSLDISPYHPLRKF
ncbi:NAD(P)/FAD-dependent oxidoreductase [Croceivirga thetidis]|uniref:FAD-dependent oxidoreductase n=1 Tax=Croceivirga thetidis TaxID=2721623 RepID=A0ABX1GSS7_9FLAO|nr:FAD-dependent oxidoreductase [Croceivirga thetidis]NKI32096.1 FAD-dependent oxidoreductase [Croceivirga thetidis]